MTSSALGTVMVISTMGMPPWQTASAAIRASPGDDARTTGTIPTSTWCLSIGGHPFSITQKNRAVATPESFQVHVAFLN
jgi:hypothetical protein